MSTFVSVGNATQPFCRLLDEVTRLAMTLPQPVIVQYGVTPFQSGDHQAVPFVKMDEFERLVSGAELLILHAGAGSVIHAVRAGKVPVVMPRRVLYNELVDDHQVEFAMALEAAGRVVVAEGPAQLADAVRRALNLQRGAAKAVEASPMLRLVDEALASYARKFS